jgi:hypothetical protein
MSNLLEQASLVMIPSGYKEDVVYSEIPLDGSGDLSFTRASNGTRVNFDGVVEVVPWNLLQQSETFANATWTKNNATISADSIVAPNGTLTADLFTKTSAVDTVSQVATTSSPYNTTGIYTYSIYIKQNVGNNVLFRLDSAGNSCNSSFTFSTKTLSNSGANFISSSYEELSNGWFRISLTGNVTSTTWVISGCLLFSNPTNDSVYIWGAQLNIGSTAKPYFPTTDRLNVPRLTYQNGGGGCPSLLLEKQSTNLTLYSEQFNDAAWTKNNLSVSANSTTAPDGNTTADTLTPTTANALHNVFSSVSKAASSLQYAFTVFVKPNGYNFIIFRIDDGGGNGIWCGFNVSTGVVTASAAAIGSGFTAGTASTQSASNGFYRCSVTFTTNTSVVVRTVLCVDNAGTGNPFTPVTFAGNGTDGIYLWGAQLEAGAYPTSYIPTTTASATRVVDSFSRNNIYTNGLITSSGGTWFVELRENLLYEGNFSQAQTLGLGTPDIVGSNANNFWLQSTAGLRIRIWKQVAGNSVAIYTTTTDTTKIAIKWDGTTADIFANGTKVVTASSFTATVLENLRTVIVTQPYFISQMDLFPTPLTDAECIALTTI